MSPLGGWQREGKGGDRGRCVSEHIPLGALGACLHGGPGHSVAGRELFCRRGDGGGGPRRRETSFDGASQQRQKSV